MTAPRLRRLCVFCGSSVGRDPAYRRLAESLGRALAARGIGVVFGGGRVGLMGALELADGFVALPGGVGTLEELFEVWTWGQLGLHAKPCGVLDAGDFYAPLIAFLDHLVETGFVRPAHRAMLVSAGTPDALLAAFEAYRPPEVAKWSRPSQV
jgi:predicted Rossmann-fold nucleotide-binding protein